MQRFDIWKSTQIFDTLAIIDMNQIKWITLWAKTTIKDGLGRAYIPNLEEVDCRGSLVYDKAGR